ncbi:MAG: hypothetical protein ACXW1A_04640 [Nitrososphaeraceae archaeon]
MIIAPETICTLGIFDFIKSVTLNRDGTFKVSNFSVTDNRMVVADAIGVLSAVTVAMT